MKNVNDKFKNIYDGPYVIKDINGSNIKFELSNGSIYEIHKNRVLRY